MDFMRQSTLLHGLAPFVYMQMCYTSYVLQFTILSIADRSAKNIQYVSLFFATVSKMGSLGSA